MPKTIVVCFDGTWDDKDAAATAQAAATQIATSRAFDSASAQQAFIDAQIAVLTQTNVAKLFDALANEGKPVIHPSGYTSVKTTATQTAFYSKGVGTSPGWSDEAHASTTHLLEQLSGQMRDFVRHTYNKFMAGAFGFGLDEIVKSAYAFLADAYQPGDKILLFGFSRGAYSARSLVGFIRNIGLINPARLPTSKSLSDAVNEGYVIYRSRDPIDHVNGSNATAFFNAYAYPLYGKSEATHDADTRLRINFLGVWDTVGALGIPKSVTDMSEYLGDKNHAKYQFHDLRLSKIVANAYHALAVDERRDNFAPSLWLADIGHTRSEQCWFPGAHGDIGGGYPVRDGHIGLLSDITLEWMLRNVQQYSGISLALNANHDLPSLQTVARYAITAAQNAEATHSISGGGEYLRQLYITSPDERLSEALKIRFWGYLENNPWIRPAQQPPVKSTAAERRVHRIFLENGGYKPDNIKAVMAMEQHRLSN